MTEDTEVKILEEAVQTSYRKGGSASVSGDMVSRETVMHKLHALKFPKVKLLPEKRTLKYLYIDADEDHVALQYINQKWDIKKPGTNTVMPKRIYVYEGITDENGRNELLHKAYFGGVYEGGKAVEKAKSVLRRFHMHKYIIGATAHLLDSAEDARGEICRVIYGQRKWQAEGILAATEGTVKRCTVESAKDYILGNQAGIMQWIKDKNKEVECSAEGHISHIFAERMSSRPHGWSREGADKMSRLRIYEKNGGDMLELVRFPKEELPIAAGCEEVIYSSSRLCFMERKNREELGALAAMPVYSVP